MSTASLHGMLWTSHWEDAGRQQKSEMLPREPSMFNLRVIEFIGITVTWDL